MGYTFMLLRVFVSLLAFQHHARGLARAAHYQTAIWLAILLSDSRSGRTATKADHLRALKKIRVTGHRKFEPAQNDPLSRYNRHINRTRRQIIKRINYAAE
jgi:hypothetical protein